MLNFTFVKVADEESTAAITPPAWAKLKPKKLFVKIIFEDIDAITPPYIAAFIIK